MESMGSFVLLLLTLETTQYGRNSALSAHNLRRYSGAQ